jgi:hypothetical protein
MQNEKCKMRNANFRLPRVGSGLHFSFFIFHFAFCSFHFAICTLLFFFSGCAGYQIGNQSLYPPEIHTVSVPVFQSNSFRRNLGERLTEAVVKEIEKRTPYKVINDPCADSVLSGRILAETKGVLVPAPTGDARDIEANMRVQVTWVDRKGRLLRDEQSIPLPAEIAEVSTTADVVPEVGQSIATVQQEAICRLAEQIVGLMEKPW